jgi:hypothetical protein
MRSLNRRYGWSCVAVSLFILCSPLARASSGITVSPNSINFGTEAVGLTTKEIAITVTNNSGSKITVTSFSLSIPEFQLAQGIAPFDIAPGSKGFYVLQFAPDAAGRFSGTFTLNIANTDGFVIPLTGVGQTSGAIASVNPTTIGFGNVPEGQTAPSQTVTVTNTGTTTMKVLTLLVEPPFVQTGFNPTTLAPGQSSSFSVGFEPSAAAAFAQSLMLTYDVLPANGVNVTGTGTAATALAIPTFVALPDAIQGAAYSAPLSAAGGTSPYQWTIPAGSKLPTGLGLSSSSGVISGTLSANAKAGANPFLVQAQDSAIPPTTVTKQFTIPVYTPTGATCNNIDWDIVGTSTPIVPIDVLGTGTYLGYQAGLYPNGSNADPSDHDSFGVGLAQQIQPLDANGNPDPNGKEVLLLFGESAVHLESSEIVLQATAVPNKNPSVVVVNGGQGDGTAAAFSDINSPFWSTLINNILPNSQVDANQVVVAWLEPIDSITSGTFPSDISSLQTQIEEVAQNVLTKFPNVKLLYLSSRIYGGYSDGLAHLINPEPYAYEAGFAVKWAIQDQLDGDPALNFDPSKGQVRAPWMAWGPYYWGNGLIPRPDSLVWSCPDLLPDGTHPSQQGGVQKVATEWLGFFTANDTTVPWFLAP